MTRSMILRLSTPGTNDAPMPWMAWGRALPPDSTGERAGSTATTCTPDIFSLRTSPTPVSVPPVPTPATNAAKRRSPSASKTSATGLQRATTLGLFHHGHGDAVLDAAPGIQRLDFRDHGGATRLWQAIEAHHGRVPDELEDVGGDRRSAHGGSLLRCGTSDGRRSRARARVRPAR